MVAREHRVCDSRREPGLSYFGMSAFFPSFEREFGGSGTAVSGAFFLSRASSPDLLGTIEGYLINRSASATTCGSAY